MRIIRARQQAELLAAFQRTAGWADWKNDDSPGFLLDKATLENGHRLSVGQSFLTPGSWGYNIYGPATEDDEWPEIASGPATHGKEEYPRDPSRWSHDFLTREQAREAAEKHYEKLFPIGTDTGGHDSGVDYSDLNKFMGEL